jgi:hypothetical protein
MLCVVVRIFMGMMILGVVVNSSDERMKMMAMG